MILSTADAKIYLKLSPDSTSEDAIIEGFCKSAHATIEKHCGQPIEEGLVNFRFEGNDSYEVLLPYSRVQFADEFAKRSKRGRDFEAMTTGGDVFQSGGLWYAEHPDGFSDGMTYNVLLGVGFGDEVPDDIKQVAREMVGIMYADAPATAEGSARLGLNAIGTNDPATGSSTTQFKDMCPKWEKVLDMYKLPNF